jgi:hypothetical protein
LPLQVFVAELAVPLRSSLEVFVAVGQGHNKAEAERVCCTAACEKLHQEGLLNKPSSKNSTSSAQDLKPGSTKAAQIQQVSFLSSSFMRQELTFQFRSFVEVEIFVGVLCSKMSNQQS